MGRVATIIREKQDVWLKGILGLVFVLNVVDAVLTIAWVSAGLAEEANPFMRKLLSHGPVVFFVGKLAIVGGGSYILWRHRKRPLAVIAIFLLFVVYYWVLIHHLSNVGELLGS